MKKMNFCLERTIFICNNVYDNIKKNEKFFISNLIKCIYYFYFGKK